MKNHRQTLGESAETGAPHNEMAGSMPAEYPTPDPDAFCMQQSNAESSPLPLETAIENNIYAVELLTDLLENPSLPREDVEEILKFVIRSAQSINILSAKSAGITYKTND